MEGGEGGGGRWGWGWKEGGGAGMWAGGVQGGVAGPWCVRTEREEVWRGAARVWCGVHAACVQWR